MSSRMSTECMLHQSRRRNENVHNKTVMQKELNGQNGVIESNMRVSLSTKRPLPIPALQKKKKKESTQSFWLQNRRIEARSAKAIESPGNGRTHTKRNTTQHRCTKYRTEDNNSHTTSSTHEVKLPSRVSITIVVNRKMSKRRTVP